MIQEEFDIALKKFKNGDVNTFYSSDNVLPDKYFAYYTKAEWLDFLENFMSDYDKKAYEDGGGKELEEKFSGKWGVWMPPKMAAYASSSRFIYELLKDNGVKYTRSGDHIVAGCPHSEWEDGVCTRCGIHCLHETYDNGACTVCGKACENEFHNGKYTCPDCGMVVGTSATGSILSHGYPEIVYGIGGIAIGVVATLLISRKKKVAVSSAAGEDENE